ncbi:hypothetical protein MMC17_002572 [Xylographa soralifera]|nr:hypothetical protein [Xylographa soralifera]
MNINLEPGLQDVVNDLHLSPENAHQSRTIPDSGLGGNRNERKVGGSRNQPPTFIVSEEAGQTKSQRTDSQPSIIVESSSEPSDTTQTSSDIQRAGIYKEPENKSPNQPRPSDIVLPPEVFYTLEIIYEKKLLPGTEVVRSVPIDGGYNRMDKIAEHEVESDDSHLSNSKELYVRYGSCKINLKEGREEFYDLKSNEDWKEVCKDICSYWQSGKLERFHLDISREYFSLQTKVGRDTSFASLKRDEIADLMKPSLNGGEYIPRTDLERLTSTNTIRQLVHEDESLKLSFKEKETFIQIIYKTSRTLLAACVYHNLKMKCLKLFIDKGLDDTSLPLEKSTEVCHSKGCRASFRAFLAQQGSFLAPAFTKVGEHMDLQPGVALPMQYYQVHKHKQATASTHGSRHGSTSFSREHDTDPTKSKTFCGSGAFSNVYRVRVDLDHHMFSKNKDYDFAIKEFVDRPERVSVDFHREVEVLEQLRPYISKKPIVTHYASWTQDGRYYMLLPYAECNLSEYMSRTTFGPMNKDNIRWLLRQFRGLVDAMESVHTVTAASGPNTKFGPALPPANAATHKEIQKSGWHHDIKPENILYFLKRNEESSSRVDLCLADFGSGRVQFLRSGSLQTRSATGTPTYEAPDGTANGGGISRPYDVWSLGCVFLEILTWASWGYEAVQQFGEQRQALRFPGSEDKGGDDSFWQKDTNGRIYLRKVVEETIQRLEAHFNKEGHLASVVTNLLPKMLDVNPKTRIKASELLDGFNQIYKKAKANLADIDDDALPHSTP